MHLRRLVVAGIFIPLLYFYVTKLPAEYYFYLMVAVGGIALHEFYSMFRLDRVLKYTGILWGAGLMTAHFMTRIDMFTLVLVTVLFFLGLRLFLRPDASSSMHEVSTVLLGLLYIPGLLTFQTALAVRNPQWIILLYTAVWAADGLAFYVGKSLGRHKLYEAISPNKTIEGAFGSLAGGVLGAGIIKAALIPELSPFQFVVIGLTIGAATIIGDLAESMLKRDAGVKDSGTLFPEHGGILDKIDGSTFAGPAFFWISAVLGLMKQV